MQPGSSSPALGACTIYARIDVYYTFVLFAVTRVGLRKQPTVSRTLRAS